MIEDKGFLHKLWLKADKRFKTNSDIAGVRIGNNDFWVNVYNGMGDGITRVGIFYNTQNAEIEFAKLCSEPQSDAKSSRWERGKCYIICGLVV